MNRLAEIRTAKGMTQSQLADACGISQKMVSALETGIRKPSYTTLMKLSEALSVPMDDLADKEEVIHDRG